MKKHVGEQPPPLAGQRVGPKAGAEVEQQFGKRSPSRCRWPCAIARNTATFAPNSTCVRVMLHSARGAVPTAPESPTASRYRAVSPRCAASCCTHHWQIFFPKSAEEAAGHIECNSPYLLQKSISESKCGQELVRRARPAQGASRLRAHFSAA